MLRFVMFLLGFCNTLPGGARTHRHDYESR